MPDDTNTDNDTICSSDDTIRSSECEHPLTSQLAKILAILPDRLISRGVEGVIAALHEVRHIERHCRNHPAAASVQAVELLDNAHRLDTIVQRYLGELSRATAKAQRDTAERELDAAKSILLESLGLDESTIEAAARLAAGAPLPSGHVDPTPNPLVVRLAEVLTGCPMSSTELAETRVTRAAAAILSWLADPKVPAVKLAPWLPSMPEDHDGEGLPPMVSRETVATLMDDLRTDLIEATGLGPDASFKDIIQAAQCAFRQRSDLALALGYGNGDIPDWSTLMDLVGRVRSDADEVPAKLKAALLLADETSLGAALRHAGELTSSLARAAAQAVQGKERLERLAGALGLSPDAEYKRVLARAQGLVSVENDREDHGKRAIEACRVDLAGALGFGDSQPWEILLGLVKTGAAAYAKLCMAINEEQLLPDEPASDTIVKPVLRTLRRARRRDEVWVQLREALRLPAGTSLEEAVRYTAALSQVAPKAAAEAPADAQTLANARRRDLAAALIVGDDEPWGKLVDRVKGMVKQHSLDRIQMEGALRSLHDREQFRFKMASAMDLPAMTSEVELVDIARQATIALRARSGDAKKPLLGIEHSKLLAILDPQGKHSLSLEDLYDLVVILAKAEAPASSNCFSDYEVAKLLHESGRPAAKAGQSVSGVTAFVGWSDLTCVVRAGRLWSARNLMNAAFVGDAPAPAGSTVLCKEAVARAIHLAERETIDRGWVLNPTGKPWIEFDDLGEAARAGRMRQAEALEIAKIALWVWDK